METIRITPYESGHKQQIAQLITGIQQQEFNIPITLEDQPDLNDIPAFYQQQQGNFWCALNTTGEVVGTIALIDVGHQTGVIRKMFVREDYRGKEKNIAGQLLQTLETHAAASHIRDIYLGTVSVLQAAQRFYNKHGYTLIAEENLPAHFPKMKVDTVFFHKQL